jgi:hypothetical protein
VFHGSRRGAFPEFWDQSGSMAPREWRVERRGPAPRSPSDGPRVAAMATQQSSVIIERVWSRLPEGSRAVLESELSPTDLQSLLLSLVRTRASRIGPAETLRRWKATDSYVPRQSIRVGCLPSRFAVAAAAGHSVRRVSAVPSHPSGHVHRSGCGEPEPDRQHGALQRGGQRSLQRVGTRGGTSPPVGGRSGAFGQLSSGVAGSVARRIRRLRAFRPDAVVTVKIDAGHTNDQ